MSSPSNRMVPAVGVSCSRISLDVVVLPQPDSPINPRVSPGWIVISTPSTALTQPILRRNSTPVPTGKYFRRFCSSSNGADIFFLCPLVDEPAFCRPIRSDPTIVGLSRRTLRQRIGTTRTKGAAGTELREVGRLARDCVERLLAPELGHRAEQRLGVGMLRGPEQVAHRALLDDLPGIHDRHLVAHLRDDTEIMGHEDQ